MASLLQDICEQKRNHIAYCKKHNPIESLHQKLPFLPARRPFLYALREQVAANKIGLIAEAKKASPSKGVIREPYDPAAIGLAYQQGGATCLSVLTDVPYFQGRDEDLVIAHETTTLPVLRKDFILDPYQVLEAKTLGADCILLIMAALTDDQAQELESTAKDFGMDVLVEVHNEAELERALSLETRMIGINNRDLSTFVTDIATSERLRPLIPEDYLVVSESGIADIHDIRRLRAAGIHCFLVGESLLSQANITKATQDLLGDGRAWMPREPLF